MTLSEYHRQFLLKNDDEIKKRINEKEQELAQIFNHIEMKNSYDVVRVAVLGCADRRLIQGHENIFEKILNKKVELTTFDLTTEHLVGEKNVVQHDCTLPLPNTPYDITYAHVLLKFIPVEKQFDLIINSFTALGSNGIAIHVLDRSNYETKGPKLSDEYFTVPLTDHKNELTRLGIDYKEFHNKYGITLVLFKH